MCATPPANRASESKRELGMAARACNAPDRLGQFGYLCRAMHAASCWPLLASVGLRWPDHHLQLLPPRGATGAAGCDSRSALPPRVYGAPAPRSGGDMGMVARGGAWSGVEPRASPGDWESWNPSAAWERAWLALAPKRCNGPGGRRRCSAVFCMAPSPRGERGARLDPRKPNPMQANADQCTRSGGTAAKYPQARFCQVGGNRGSPCFEWPAEPTAALSSKTWNARWGSLPTCLQHMQRSAAWGFEETVPHFVDHRTLVLFHPSPSLVILPFPPAPSLPRRSCPSLSVFLSHHHPFFDTQGHPRCPLRKRSRALRPPRTSATCKPTKMSRELRPPLPGRRTCSAPSPRSVAFSSATIPVTSTVSWGRASSSTPSSMLAQTPSLSPTRRSSSLSCPAVPSSARSSPATWPTSSAASGPSSLAA